MGCTPSNSYAAPSRKEDKNERINQLMSSIRDHTQLINERESKGADCTSEKRQLASWQSELNGLERKE